MKYKHILIIGFLLFALTVPCFALGNQGLFDASCHLTYFYVRNYIDSVPYTVAEDWSLGAYFKVDFQSEYTYTFNAFFDSIVPAEMPIIRISDYELPLFVDSPDYGNISFAHNVDAYTYSFKYDEVNENSSFTVTIPSELNNLNGTKYVYILFYRNQYSDAPPFTVDRLSLSYVHDGDLANYNQSVLDNLDALLNYGGHYNHSLGGSDMSNIVNDHNKAEQSIKDKLEPLKDNVQVQKEQLTEVKKGMQTLSASAVGVNNVVTDALESAPPEVAITFTVCIALILGAFVLGILKK